MSPGFDLSIAQTQSLGRRVDTSVRATQIGMEIPDGLDRAHLDERFAAAVGTYDILRTGFVQPVGLSTVLQAVGDASAPQIADHMDSDLDSAAMAERAAIANAPSVRAAVAAGHLLLTASAALADERSLELLAAELFSGEPAEQEPLQFIDYAGWEAEQLEDEGADARIARTYWVGALGEEQTNRPEPLPVLTMKPLPVTGENLDAASWLALWTAVQARYADPDSDRVVIALAVDGRVDPDLEHALGPYERWVPLAVALDVEDTAPTLAARTARLGADVAAARRFAVFAPQPQTDAAFAARHGSSLHPARGAFPLELVVSGGRATLWYAPDAVAEARALRLVEQLGALAAATAAAPDVPLGHVDVLGVAERATLADALIGPCSHDGIDSADSINARLAALSASRGSSPAVVHGTDTLTWADLDARTAAVAAALPVGQRAVGVLLDRSTDLIAAALGIIRAGAAYVPLQPATPVARLVEQLRVADVAVVVTSAALAGRLPQSVHAIRMDEVGSAAAPYAQLSADSPAYLIFTSGSTGSPKPVVVTNGNVMAYAHSIATRLGLQSSTRFAAVTDLSTDLGNTAVFGALLSGGTLEVVPTDVLGDGPALARLVAEHGVNALKITPSHLRALLAGSDVALALDLLVIGGEALDGDLVAAARASGVQRIVNHYGPTETTIGVFTHEVPAGAAGAIPIGRPLDHVRAYVLDRRGLPAPLGAIGQLVIGGASVAAGYAGQPEATAARFVPERGHDSARMYLTGDHVRVDESGVVVFVGRSDGQVKVRGYRVELGEIETRLRQYDSVAEAAVLADDDVLTAYVVSSGPRPDVEQLRKRLVAELPEYMVPSSVTVLDRLPLTPSGKLDRRKLAEVAAQPVATGAGRAPRTETEDTLLTIWKGVLPVADLGIDDNFFQVGGHSLIATKVIARVRAHFDIDLPLHVIFASSTVASMAAEIDERLAAAAGSDDDLADLLDDLESLSDEEAARLLQSEGTQGSDQ